ncbi:hypothetical protein DPMN_122794 [Dreissena polymorpha]|uniref:Uncharacterized protein n=1 Tax=Dreissena polymorpha TaxID=45954 RepID=A0A9D4GQD9_DREPO|nr:hypothetical protein DPMN_122794 [Dreissena polymorpha]
MSYCNPARLKWGIEPGTFLFQIRQTLDRVAIKASSYSKAVSVLLIPNSATHVPNNCEIFREFLNATIYDARLTRIVGFYVRQKSNHARKIPDHCED